jgi:hypothetical protein
MVKGRSWITVTLVNLCIVAFLGMSLRTKFLFEIPFVDYRNLLSAHSHFAFGGWATLVLMVLFISQLIPAALRQKRIYQVLLWGIQLNAAGMLVTFPITGYAAFSIIFSTAFILFTYAFSWVLIREIRGISLEKPVKLLAIASLLCLVISSAGPFSLAYMMATGSGNANTFRDAIYFYLHFQYNGFFTLAVFALLFQRYRSADPVQWKRISRFTLLLILSVIPSLFLSLLWHTYNIYISLFSYLGCILLLLTAMYFLVLVRKTAGMFQSSDKISRSLLAFSMAAFAIKTVLQTGTIIPSLGKAVFSYRPIIIGYLHLVFLVLLTFYILHNLIESGYFIMKSSFARLAILFFSLSIIIHETILLVNGIGLMLKTTNPIYGWLIWVVSIFMFIGAFMLMLAGFSRRNVMLASVTNQ